MLFSSQIFFVYFLPVTLVLYYAAPKSWRHLVLTLCSYVFYGWANPLFALVMFGTTLVNYACGLVIATDSLSIFKGDLHTLPKGGGRTGRQKWAMIASVAVSLGE